VPRWGECPFGHLPQGGASLHSLALGWLAQGLWPRDMRAQKFRTRSRRPRVPLLALKLNRLIECDEG